MQASSIQGALTVQPIQADWSWPASNYSHKLLTKKVFLGVDWRSYQREYHQGQQVFAARKWARERLRSFHSRLRVGFR
jgi:hypothetical protein